MSDFQNHLKERIKRPSAHDQLIDPAIPSGDENVNVNVDVNENVNITRSGRRPKFEDTHTRSTFYIENGLLEQMNRLSDGEKGEKTRIINDALRQYLKRRG